MQKIKDFFKNNQDKIILTVGAILITACSFAAGRISVNKQTIPIEIKENTRLEAKIEQPQQNINTFHTETTKTPEQDNSSTKSIKEQKENTEKPKKDAKTSTKNDGCEFVASSRGHKYYNADSSSAKSLSEQNKICFPDAKAAEKAGYEPSASIK